MSEDKRLEAIIDLSGKLTEAEHIVTELWKLIPNTKKKTFLYYNPKYKERFSI